MSYKNVLVRGKPPTAYITVLVIVALAVLIIGLLIFDRKEAQFSRDV
jgi:ABC-type polysaccharide/polyol phosphate export permease